jgi:hypothetical protein
MTVQAEVVCPRCEKDVYRPYDYKGPHKDGDPLPPALSRTDNQTYICSACGTDEAMRDFTGAPPIPPSEWPV